MNRFPLAVTAAAISATAVTGVMAFSALGADPRPTTPERAKKLQQAGQQPGVAPAELLACLRARGLQPPVAPDELKMWIVRTPAAKPCIETGGPKNAEPGGCGAGKPAVVVGDRR